MSNSVEVKNWEDYGFSKALTKVLQPLDLDYTTSEDFQNNLEDLSISTKKIVNQAITDSKISSLTADKVTAGTITGSTLQTAATGSRTVISPDPGGGFPGNSATFFDANGQVGSMFANGNVLMIQTKGFNYPFISLHTDVSTGYIEINPFQGSGPGEVLIAGAMTVTGNLLPYSDNSKNLGDNSHRWALVRGTVITPGDLAWEETACHICGKTFKKGDKLAVVVKDMVTKDDETLTHTVPICKECLLDS